MSDPKKMSEKYPHLPEYLVEEAEAQDPFVDLSAVLPPRPLSERKFGAITNSEVVSPPDSAIRVTRHDVSREAREGLNAGVSKLPVPATENKLLALAEDVCALLRSELMVMSRQLSFDFEEDV